ncbi:hypothetical protein KPH14_011764 [Odynerus spinipes]|uniref:Cytochrome b5 heme-binding domain-containing protein n=1 Tax=Odynerus spinipes TaxID=1348599 RepID=A0AAD9VU00_9HYME|nr:hypothetical protein KPH14_011764 [Odynerus spinipes]
MITKYLWVGLLLASTYLLYSQDYFEIITCYFLSKGFNNLTQILFSSSEFSASPLELLQTNEKQKIFTKDELKKYTNIENGLYLSILGQIFDVTKGAKHYGPGASYHAFVGRDASLAFITGEFDEKELTDDISILSVQQIKMLDDWVQFYNENYIYKGKLLGRYFNKDGTPTIESFKVQQKLIHAKKKISDEEQKKIMFPSCNIEWKADVGSTVWCSKKSGGIERNWIGVPRMFFENSDSKKYRCVCANLDSKEYEENKGNFREYNGCAKSSIKCNIK